MIEKIVEPLAKRYVSTDFNELLQPSLIINHLGEHEKEYEAIKRHIIFYQRMMKYCELFDSAISIKPSQLGAPGSDFKQRLEQILFVKHFNPQPVVWLDMEGSDLTDITLQTYKDVNYKNLGICLQANLKRTISDLESLPPDSFVRLVKGAYDENSEIAYQSPREINQNFIRCLEVALERFKRIAIATHDGLLITASLAMMKCHPEVEVEFQRLKGINVDIQDPQYLLHLKTYVPFGNNWIPYFWRRLKERKRNLLFLFR